MQSSATTVDEYLKNVPWERLETLTKLRDLCRRVLEGYEEAMHYGMPGYSKGGMVEIGFASQKNYISFYVLKKEVLDAHREELPPSGKCCIRYSKPEKIDFAVVERLLRATVASSSPICERA